MIVDLVAMWKHLPVAVASKFHRTISGVGRRPFFVISASSSSNESALRQCQRRLRLPAVPFAKSTFSSGPPGDDDADTNTSTTNSNIRKAPIDETPDNDNDNETGQIAMPDRDMELKLARMQSDISEHYQNGDFSKALKRSKELFQASQAHFGQNHPATASSLNNMGLMQKLLGDFVDARQHYTAALRIYAKVLGRDHASYAMTLHNLASLNKAQVHFDTSLKVTERLSLVETALEYFEEAWIIRKAELGEDHPLTIATQSSMGATLADQLLNQHRYIEGDENNATRYVSLNPESVTRKGWEAAERHLRQALGTATTKPRGKSVNHGDNKKKKGKVPKGNKVSPPSAQVAVQVAAAASSNTTSSEPTDNEQQKEQQSPAIDTLSAASAAQNLAIVLKSRAMTEDPYNNDMIQEAHSLYERVIQVRSQLLPNMQHPDLLASKYSMAELLEVMGKKDAANTIRQEILDDYEPSPAAAAGDADSSWELPARKVVVEKTKGAPKKPTEPEGMSSPTTPSEPLK